MQESSLASTKLPGESPRAARQSLPAGTELKGPLPDVDRRDPGAGRVASAQRRAQVAELGRRVPGLAVDYDPVTGSPKWVGSTAAFLTAPQQAQAAADADAPILAFLEAHRGLFGHGPELLGQARRVTDYATARGPSRKVVWHQQYEGIDVFEAVLQANLTTKSELINIGSQFVADPEAAVQGPRQPVLAVERAVAAAGRDIGENLTAESVRAVAPAEARADRRQQFRATLLTDADARLVWLPLAADRMRLAWDVTLTSRSRAEMYRVLVDAENGSVHLRQALTALISDASYRVYTASSPTPMAPGQQTPSSLQPAELARVLVTTPALNTTASPNGWINDGDNQTSGNNVDAYTDTNADNVPDLPRTTGTPARVFDFPMNTTQEPSTYRDASVTQIFYWSNFMHDRLHELGFTEAAGNFQVDNFGRGGLGNDPVNAEALDGSGTNNANFSTPVDGNRGRMQMFVWTSMTPDRDSTFDTTVLFHEYGHGVSNRLVGGPSVTLSANTSRGMGEGWSDFYGMTLLTEATENPHGNWPAAGYLSLMRAGWLTENYYYGLRRYSYSTDLSKNPLTFKDTDPTQIDLHPEVPRNPTYGSTQDATQVHYLGTVWCTMLNEVRANLMIKHGALAGNERAMFLITEGMKYAPANPNFVQSRDGILQAALVNHPEDVGEVWTAFAKRGLGDGASAPASTTTIGVVESYRVPDALEIADRGGWNITGGRGGPFAPATKTLTLNNDGATPLTWSADPGVAWLAVTPAGGALSAGGSVEVTVTAQAEAVESGFHSANVVFANTGTGFKQPVGVRLQVTPPVVERFDFDSNPGWTTAGEWQFGVPTGAGGSAAGGAGQADPVVGATGTQVYGVNLNGNAGTGLGGPHYLVSEPVDLSNRKQTRLRFKRWLNSNALASTRSTVEVSTDGLSWREVFVNPGTAITDNAWQTLEYDLSSIADRQSAVRVRWGYQNLLTGAAYSGWNLDDVEFLGEPIVHFRVLAAAAVAENGAPLSATLEISHAQNQDLTVQLASSDTGAATVPASVTLLAGETSAAFWITPVDDAVLDGTQTTRITASVPAGIANGQHLLAVTDSETAVLTLTAPAQVTEGADPVAASVQVSAAPVRDVTVQIESSSPRLQAPASVVIPAGTTGPVEFFVTAPDNPLAEGSLAALLTATVANWTPGTAPVSVQDDESPVLLLTGPGTLREGDAPASYTVMVNTVQAVDRVLNLASDDTSELGVPATVTVPAGTFSASFEAVIQDDAETDGVRPVTITATAAGFPDATRAVAVADNDVHAFSFAPIASPQLRNQPFGIRIRALDVNGEWITNHAGVVSLTAVAGAGAPTLKPNSVAGFINGEARADVEIGGAITGLTLVAANADGRTGTSNAFDVVGKAHADFLFTGTPTFVNADTWFNLSVSAVDDTGAHAPGYQDATAIDVLVSQVERTVGSTSSITSTAKVYNTAFQDSRAQIIYTAEEMGAQPRLLSSFSHSRLTAGGQNLNNFTIRLKHTHLDSFEGQGWEQGGWTTVYETVQFTAGGLTQVFREPFWYDGVSNLMVDISFDNSTASTAGMVRTLVTSQPRMLTGTSNSEHGPPTTWSPLAGPVPELSHEVPVVTLFEARSRGAIPASPAVFSSGSWSGQAYTVGGTVWLRATAPSGVWGTSPSINVMNPGTTVGAETLFSEGFESGVLGASWSTAANSGSTARTLVTSANTPRGGSYHLTLDTTSSTMGMFASNRPTFSLDLTGRKHVSLEWYRKGFLDESHLTAWTGPLGTFGPTAAFDGVAISRDGVIWVEAASLRSLTSTYTLSRVFLDPLLNRLGWPLDGVYQIRFSQYDDQAIPNDGIAIDDIAVKVNPTSAIQVELPATIAEGTLNQTVTVRLPTAAATNTSVTLTSNGPARLSVVSPVVIAAGQTSATTTISASQNQYAEVGRDLILTASASGQTTGYHHIRVVDDEQPVLSLELPASIAEGGSTGTGLVRIDPVQAVPTTVFVAVSDTAEASVFSHVMLNAGAVSASFSLSAVNDNRLDGTRTVTLSATGQGLVPASADFDVLDNESTQLQVTAPGALTEGGSAGLGRIQLSGVRTVDTLVTLVTSDPGEATVSDSVRIPAGQIAANFQVFPVDDGLQDGPRSVTVTASATGFDAGSASFEVRDDDPSSFEVAVIASPQVRNAPFSLTLTARDDAGNVLTGFHGTVNLTASAGSTPLPLTPVLSGPFVNGVWTGPVAIGAAAADVTLTATGSDGATGTSEAFTVVPGGAAVALAFAPMALPQRAGALLPVQVHAVDADGIRVNEVSGPVSVQLVTVPAGIVVIDAALNLVEGGAATPFLVPSALPAVKLQATAGALSGESAVFAIEAPLPLQPLPPTVLFEEGFESGSLGPQWTITGTGTHRTLVTPANGPRGSHHLTMDSSVDGSNARNEATLTLDLSGREDVELSFWMKEVGDEDHAPPASSFVGGADFDGVAISADGINWHEVQGLRTADGISGLYQEFKVDLSAAAAARGLALGAAFKIRFNHFDNFTYGTDGFAFDDIRVTANANPEPEPVLTLLNEDFESGVFGPHWRITGTQNHRTEITSAQSPRGGQHLLMDAHVNGVLSRNEATLTVDLGGMQDVMLKFWMKELADEDHGPPALPFVDGADFDGVAISANGVDWYEVQGLRTSDGISGVYREFSVNLSQAAATHGLTLGTDFRIRFNHHDDSTSPSDGFAFDDIVIEARPVLALTLSTPAELAEGGSAGARVSLPAARGVDTVVELACNRPGLLNLPATVIIPAGSTESPDFSLTAAADPLLTGDLPVQIAASATGYRRGLAEVVLIDDEAPGDLVLTLPAGLAEGGSIQGSVGVTAATPFALPVRLAVAPGLGLIWPAVIQLPAGAGSASFTLAKPENDLVLEALSTTVTASLGGASDAAVVALTDNDALAPLVVTLPESVSEGGAAVAGSVGFAPPLAPAVDLSITLASSDATELTVPANLTLSAGSAGAVFDAMPQNDALADGAVEVTVTASATGLSDASRIIRVEDDELHHLAFAPIASPQERDVPFAVSVRAVAIDGRTVPSFTGTAALTAAHGGGALALTPTSTGAFVSGVWSGQVSLAGAATGVVLTADAGGGLGGSSNAFEVRMSARLVISPGALNVSLPAGESALSVPLALSNPGGLAVDWSAAGHVSGQVAEPTLEAVRAALNNGYAGITSRVPNRYDFSDGTLGSSIFDGGSDMYDYGNYLSTNLSAVGSFLGYADNGITSSSTLGSGGRYFTRKHPGLFVFAADLVGLSHFEISGDLGADGLGLADTAILTASRSGVVFKGFVKRVHGASNPSVNHLIVVQDDPTLVRTASASTNSDQHRLAGLSNVRRLYYLLFASQQGGYVTDAQMQQILEAFLDTVIGHQWLSTRPAQGSIAAGAGAGTEVILNSTNLAQGVHTGHLRFASNDSTAPQQDVPVTVTVAPPVQRFEWGAVTSPKVVNVPFAATLTAREAGGGTATSFEGEADLRALRPGVETLSGTGTTLTSRGLDAGSYQEVRTQYIYLPAEVGPAGVLRSIALDLGGMPSTLTDFVVRVKHTDKTSYAGTGNALWESVGWTTVYRSDLTVSAPGWLVLPLNTSFEYDGQRPLMVDFSFDNTTFGSSGSSYATSTATSRGLYGGTSGGNPPLGWTGTSPSPSTTTFLPNLRFSTQPIVPVSPARVAFTDGIWSGQLAVQQSGTDLSLEAVHAVRREVAGTSSTLAVTSVGSLSLSVPATGVEGGNLNATLSASSAPATDLVVSLSSSDVSEATAPAQVVLPAGQTSTGFVISLVDDSELDGSRPVAVTATAAAYERGTGSFTVGDNEATAVSLVLPASLNENSSSSLGQARVQVADAPTADLLISLTSSQPTHLTVPATVVVPAGLTSVGFVLTAPQNTLLEGPQNVVITATLAGSTPATGTVQVVDNESRALSLSLFHSSLSEGAAVYATGGRVTLGGTVTAPLTLQLTSSDTGELAVPATITVPAGSSMTPIFSLTPVNDSAFDGSQVVTVTASAATFTDSSRTITVDDDDAHHFTVSNVPVSQVRQAPFNVSFTARDINGKAISLYTGTPVLTAAAAGVSLAVTPGSINGFSSGGRTVAVTIMDYAAAAVLTLTDPVTGGAGSSNAFAVGTGPHARFGWSAIPSPQLPGQSFDVTLTAQDSFGNTITDYTGTAALSLPDYRQVGSATGSMSPPLDTLLHDSRTQILYTANEVGGAGTIRALALKVLAAPVQAMNAFTIRLRHSSKTDYATSAVWEATDWTTCYQANVTVSGSGWREFRFTTPFEYNGTDSLMVDISFNNSSSLFDNSARVASTVGTVARTLYFQSYNQHGDPLTWAPGAGPTPSALLHRPDIRFELESVQAVSPATTTAFVNGVWTGAVTVSRSGLGQVLQAQEGVKLGLSNPFETVGEPLAFDPEPAFTGGLANTLSWNAPAPGLEYQVERASTADFVAPVTLDFQSGASASFDGLVDGQLYHYRVRMRRVGDPGWTSDWSSVVSSRQDASPPLLVADPVTTLTAEAVVSGTSTDAAGIGEVRVAGALVSSSDGFATWSTTVNGLAIGYNDLQVTASDGAVPPNTAEITVSVLRRGQQVIDFAGIPDQLATSSVQLTATGGASGNPVRFAVTSGPGVIQDQVLAFTGAGSVTVTASQAGDEIYLPAEEVSHTFTVSKAPAVVQLGNLAHLYDGTPRAATVTTTPAGLAVDLSYDGSATPPAGAGSYAVVATVNEALYQGSAAATLEIGKAGQAIVFGPLADALTTASIPLSASGGNSGNPVVFTVAEGPAVIAANVLTFTGAGMVTVTASQAGNADHLPAEPVSRSLTVTKATSSIQFAGRLHIDDGTPRALSFSTDPEGLDYDLLYEGDPAAPVLSGHYAVTATLDDPLYSGSGATSLTLLGLSGRGERLLSGSDEPQEANGSDFGPVVLGRVGTQTFTLSNPGTEEVALTGSPLVELLGEHAGDFQVSVPPAASIPPGGSVSFEVRFAPTQPGLRLAEVRLACAALANGPVTFAVAGFGALPTLLAQSITFNLPASLFLSQGPVALSATASSGLPVSLSVLSGPAVLADGRLNLTGAGTVKVEARQDGGGNHAAAKPVVRTLQVKADPEGLTLANLQQTYDGSPRPVLVLGTEEQVEVIYFINQQPGATPPTRAGSYPVQATAGGVTRKGTLVIARAPLIVHVQDQRRLVGQANPALGYAIEGFLGEDDEATVLTAPISLATKAKEGSPPGLYPIVSTGGAAANYTLLHRPGTLVVEGHVGSFEALLRDPDSGEPVGLLKLTVPGSGRSGSASLMLGEQAKPLALAGPLEIDEASRSASARWSRTVNARDAATGAALSVVYELALALSPFGELTGVVEKNAQRLAVADDGTRLQDPVKGQSVPQQGHYTAVLETVGSGAEPTAPGWATARVDAAGTLTLAGKLGDGTAFSAGLRVDLRGGYRWFAQPYKRAGAHVGGAWRFLEHPRLPGLWQVRGAELRWRKSEGSKDAGYRSGFGPLSVELGMDAWQVPGKAVGLSEVLGTEQLEIEHAPTGSDSEGQLPTLAALAKGNSLLVLAPETAPLNARKWKAKISPATGTFMGSFELQDGAQKRKVTFGGVLRQQDDAAEDGLQGSGHLVLPPLKHEAAGGLRTGTLRFWQPD